MGWTFNADPDAVTGAGLIVGVGVFFALVSFSAVSLRLYVRAKLVKNVNIDDWIIVGTWFTSFLFMSITLAQTRWGLGLQTKIPSQNTIEFLSLQFAGAPFYIITIFGFKLSVLFSFLRQAVDLTYRKALISLVATLSLFHFLYFFIQIGLCSPASKQWSPSIPGHCLPTIPFNTATSIITLLLDLLTLLAPTPLLLHAPLSTRKQALITALYTLALFTTLLQAPRILAIRHSNTSSLQTWSLLYLSLAITTSCLPTLGPLIPQSFLEKNSLRPVASPRSEVSDSTTGTQSKLARAKASFSRLRAESEVWARFERFVGYGELPLPSNTNSNRQSISLDRRHSVLASRASDRPGTAMSKMMGRLGMGSRMGSTDELNEHGPARMEWSGEMGGIIKTTEVIVSRERSEMWEGPSPGRRRSVDDDGKGEGKKEDDEGV